MSRAADPKPPTGATFPSRLGVLSAVALGTLFLAVNIQKIWSVDIWTLLRMGQWITDHRQFPRTDVFSFTARGREWIELRWLFCVLLYAIWKVGGWVLVILAKTVILAVAFGLIARPLRKSVRDPLTVMILALGLYGGAARWIVRPELCTYLFVAVYLIALETAWRGPVRGWVWCLPFLQVVWTNSHTVFILGPVIVWAFAFAAAAHALVSKLRGRPFGDGPAARAAAIYAAVAPLTTAACLVNPYFVRGAVFPLKLFRELGADHVFGRAITEFRGFFYHSPADWPAERWAVVALFGACLATFAANWRRLNLARAGLFAASVYLGAMAVRNVGLLAIVATWAALRNLSDLREQGDLPGQSVWMNRGRSGWAHLVVAAVLLVASWDVVTDRNAQRIGSPREFGFGVVEREFPVGAARFVLDSGVQPNIFHALREGGYLMWACGNRLPVYTDGRLEVYDEAFLRQLFTLRPADWPGIVERWGIRTVLLNQDDPSWLASSLLSDNTWALVYFDHRNMVFVRNISEHAALISRHRVDPSRRWAPPPVAPDDPPGGWRRWIGAPGQPWYAFGLSDMYLQFGNLENALAVAEWGRRRYPTNARLGLNIAQIDRALGRSAEAEAIESGLPDSLVHDPLALVRLAGLLMQRGRHVDTISPLREAISTARSSGAAQAWRLFLAQEYLATGDAVRSRETFAGVCAASAELFSVGDWRNYGLACEQTGDLQGAIRAYRECLRRDARQPTVLNQLGVLFMESDDRRAAKACFEAALKLDPGYESAKVNLMQLNAGARSP